jgi:hypothetical protein
VALGGSVWVSAAVLLTGQDLGGLLLLPPGNLPLVPKLPLGNAICLAKLLLGLASICGAGLRALGGAGLRARRL